MLFKRTRDRLTESQPSEQVAFFGEGVELQGFIQTSDPLRISGSLEGSILSRSRVVLEAQCSVQGDIRCHDAEIYGRVTGDLDVLGPLRLKANAAVEGDITAERLQVDEGVRLKGKCVTKAISADR
jgi:cytoskeletal protein CcmA (bactofilin family)